MNKKDFAGIIALVRRAPLQNMNEAEAVAKLLQKFAAHATEQLELTAMHVEGDDGETQPELSAV